MEVNRYFAPGK